MSGKHIRLQKLFKHAGRLLTVPMDHGMTLGPVKGLESMSKLVQSVTKGGADALIVHKGLIKQISPYLNPESCELIIHLSASTSLSPDSNRKELITSVEQAIRLGATAVSVHVNLASKHEADMLKDVGMVADQCDFWGIPLLAMMYVRDGSKESEYDPVKIKHAARVAEESGADIVKIYYTGSKDSFADISSTINIPIIIAGGPRLNSTYDLLLMINNAMAAGAKGVSIGRNIFQHDNPMRLVAAIRKVLDDNLSEEMLKVLADTCDTL